MNFVENKGQWPEQVSYRADMLNAALWVEDKGLRFAYLHPEDLEKYHDAFHEDKHSQEEEMLCRAHAYSVEFLGAGSADFEAEDPISTYFNYFQNSDSSKWVSKAKAFTSVFRKEMYKDIAMRLYSQHGNFKYDLILNAGADPSQIRLAYHGVELSLKNGDIWLDLSTGKMIEKAPYAYQIIDGNEVKVPCAYSLKNNEISFVFPEAYDKKRDLIIDPELLFSTYSGSTASNWGFCSAFDDLGNMYAGGVVFQMGYPTTEGAFQTSFWNLQDIGISKYNQTGNEHIYATYLGGSEGRDFPLSFMADHEDNLVVFGTTNANNYPTKMQSYDPDYNGNYDLIVTKFNADGSDLIGSSYLGGSDSDGRTQSVVSPTSSDILIGGLFVDEDDMIYVASATFSTDFPLSDNSQALQGENDACLIKFNPDISEVIFSRLYGGSDHDMAHSIMKKEGIFVVLGETESYDFPTSPGVVNENALGGVDGFLLSLNEDGDILHSSYTGGSGNQFSYYVDVGSDASIYICGSQYADIALEQTEGLYSVEDGNCFIQQFSSDLSVLQKSSLVAAGMGKVTAFMIDQCDRIYLSGYGGFETYNNGISANAIQDVTVGQDFYLMVLEEGMDSLLYGTYYGGPLTSEHTDGGHSRFDKRGVVYQTVCACGDDFPTTPGSIFMNRENQGCSMAAFKLDFDLLGLNIHEQSGRRLFCDSGPYLLEFSGGGDDLQDHYWDFGDGSQSNEANPSHYYSEAGDYQVEYIVFDSLSCFYSDTSLFDVQIEAREDIIMDYEYSLDDPCSESLAIALNFKGANVDEILWDLGDGNSAQGEVVFYEYAAVNSYQIELSVNDLVCDRSENVQFIVDFYENVNENDFVIPTIFTPNNDGLNDVFELSFGSSIKSLSSIEIGEVHIYDRWGKEVFSANGNEWIWDGLINGRAASDGVYFYVLKYVNHCSMGLNQQRKGSVTLVR
jgi:gliding motility-associated-like protein